MSDILSTITTRTRRGAATPQNQPRTRDQIPNAAGGFAYKAGDEMRLHRFLTIGTDGGTYYTSAQDLTKDNAEVVFRMAKDKGLYTVGQIVEISEAGRAPKNKQAIFALAICAAVGDEATKVASYAALPKVVRTGTHLFEFINYSMQFRGWGMGLRKAVGRWFTEKDVDRLAYQVLKYRQREGITHFDVLRQSHATAHVPTSAEHAALFNWICSQASAKNEKSPRHGLGTLIDRDGRQLDAELPALIGVFEELQWADTPLKRVVELINSGVGVSWEMIPDRFINEPKVWEALIAQGLPQTALMRQLTRLSRIGLDDGSLGRTIAAQLQDPERLKKARVHPINVLVALRTYTSGRNEHGTTWIPSRVFSDALDAAFYAAFGAFEPAGKRTLLALDVSGSMSSRAAGLPISCREASGALAMVIAATEPHTEVLGFTSGGSGAYSFPGRQRSAWGYGGGGGISKLDISPRRRLDDNLRAISNLPFGGTDCALPMVWAKNAKEQFDTFQVYTDNETWAGNIHVDEALEQYRQSSGIDARLEIVAMTANGTSLCNPEDARQLDVSGFDSTVPQLLNDHSGGRL